MKKKWCNSPDDTCRFRFTWDTETWNGHSKWCHWKCESCGAMLLCIKTPVKNITEQELYRKEMGNNEGQEIHGGT
jgi:hypothetical protein